MAHAAVLMKDFTVCQQANTSQFVAPIDTYDGQTSMKGALVIPLTWKYTQVASFPGSSPAFCRILYSMRQKAGEEPGNEAIREHTDKVA